MRSSHESPMGAALLLTAALAAATTATQPASAQAPPTQAASTPAPPPPGAPVAVPGYMPPTLAWNKGDPIPAGYTPSTEIRTGFVVGGGVTLGVTWLFGSALPSVVLLTGCGKEAGPCATGATLLVPGIGPFIAMAPLAAWSKGDTNAAPAYVILALDGIVQSTGAALLLYGLLAQKDVLVRKREVGENTLRWMPTPMRLGASGHGLGVVGTF